MWFKKKDTDKPAYLKYKRGHIFEKERTEREHLLLTEETESSPENEELEFMVASPKRRVGAIAGALGLVIFLIFFSKILVGYTTSLFGEKIETETNRPAFEWKLKDKELSLPDIAVTLPDLNETRPASEGEDKSLSLRPTLPEVTIEKKETDTETSNDTYTFSVSIHENLIQSIENIKDAVIRYTEGQANKMVVSSRIEKEQLLYKMYLAQVEERLYANQFESPSEKEVLRLLQAQIMDLHSDTAIIKETSRMELADVTNNVISNENGRRGKFLAVLKDALKADDVPFSNEKDELSFQLNE